MSTLDDDVLDTLTPEEREAMQDDESDEQEQSKGASETDEDDADDDEEDEGDDGDDDAGAPPEEGKAAAPKAAEPEPEAAPQPVVPRYEAQLPQDYDDQIKSLKGRDAELRQKFKDGEIDIDERDAGLAELSEQRERLLVARAKAEISQEMTQQTAASQWQSTINAFVAQAAKPENGGIDYRKDAAMANDWDQFVRVLAAKPENADKPMEWFLSEAHKRTMALHGVAKAPAAPKDPLADAKAKRKPPAASTPSLAHVPGSDGPGDVGDEFSDVLALDGLEFEQAIAKMSAPQREKFLRGR
jgi:hypothetical protein